MRAATALVDLVLLSLVARASQESLKTAKKELQGTWVLKEIRVSDEKKTKLLMKRNKGMKVTFSGDKVTIKRDGKDHPGSYRIDPSKSPKEIDLIMKEPDGKEEVTRGIYEHKGNRLTMCLGTIEADSPKKEKGKFKGDGESKRPASMKATGGAMLLRFAREKQ
jgi:uncharacterized protein (TIGR03067 family)